MPNSITIWADALAAVDQTRAPSTKWNYCVPEPALIVGPKSAEMQQRYLSNWLRVREAWLYILGRRPRDVDLVAPQWWRDFLNMDVLLLGLPQKDTRTGSRKLQVQNLFTRVFSEQELSRENVSALEWFGSSIIPLQPAICRQVLWELFEVGFRFELLELDRHLCPSSGQSTTADAEEIVREDLISRVFPNDLSLRVKALPSSYVGLAARNVQDRSDTLEALRTVMCRWPNVPSAIRTAQCLRDHRSDTYVRSIEKKMVAHYVQTFYDCSGRAAVVPHLFPFE